MGINKKRITCSSVNFFFVCLADSLSKRKYSFIFRRSSLSPFDPLLQDEHWQVAQAQIVSVKRKMTRRHSAVELPTIAGTILMMSPRNETADKYENIIIRVNMDNNNCQKFQCSILDKSFTILCFAVCECE